MLSKINGIINYKYCKGMLFLNKMTSFTVFLSDNVYATL